MGIIYLITNKVDGKKYVGQTQFKLERRWKRHISDSLVSNKRVSRTLLHSAIRKYGPDNFLVEILEDNIVKEFLNNREIYWIAKLNTLVPNGYNLTKGGDSNPMDNEFSKNKHDNSMKSLEVRKKISNSMVEIRKLYPDKYPGKPREKKRKPRSQRVYHYVNGKPCQEHQQILLNSRYKKFLCIDSRGNQFFFNSGIEASEFWNKILNNSNPNEKSRYKHGLSSIRGLIQSGKDYLGYHWFGGSHDFSV